MAANTVPRFIATPRSWMVSINVANPSTDGSGATTKLLDAGANGSKVDMFVVQAPGAVRAGLVTFYLATSAPTLHPFDAIAVSAASAPMENAEGFRQELVPTQPVQIPPNWAVYVSTLTSDAFSVFAIGGDY